MARGGEDPTDPVVEQVRTIFHMLFRRTLSHHLLHSRILSRLPGRSRTALSTDGPRPGSSAALMRQQVH